MKLWVKRLTLYSKVSFQCGQQLFTCGFGRLVGQDHYAGGRRLGVDQSQRRESAAVGEETSSRS